MSFHQQFTPTLTAGVGEQALVPSQLAGRFQNEADAWQLFRFISFRYRIFGDNTHSVGTPASAGIIEGWPDTRPATLVDVTQLQSSVMHCGAGQTKWSAWLNVPAAVCRGQLPWYKTIQGTFTNVEEIPMGMAFFGSSTGVIRVELMYTVEFKSQSSTANTPQGQLLAERIRQDRLQLLAEKERKKLVGILAPTVQPDLTPVKK